MFSIKTIRLEDFKSYKGKHRFDFPVKPGLYFLTGDNQEEPRLESNGAGKSTLLDAIYWCLYGVTLRGLTAGNVPTWQHPSCRVSVDLCIAGTDVTVTRTYKPNKFTITEGNNTEIVVNESINTRLGIGFRQFVHSVIHPQFGQTFFDYSPTEKLALFSGIMNLDHWLDKSRLAAEKAEVTAAAITVSKTLLVKEIETLEIYQTHLRAYDAKARRFEDDRINAIKDIEDQAAGWQATIDRLTNTQHALRKRIKAVQTALERVEGDITQIDEALTDHRASDRKLTEKLGVIKGVAASLYDTFNKLASVDGKCPTCLQTADEAHLKKEKRRVERQIEDQLAKQDEVTKARDNIRGFIQIETDNLTSLGKNRESLCTKLSDTRVEIATATQNIENCTAKIIEAGLEIKRKEREESPFAAFIAEKEQGIETLEAGIAQRKDIIKKMEENLEAVTYWVSGFKKIRLFIIEETLRTLEIEVNNSLANLGLPDWSVEFDVERENKSGGVTKGFVVLIRCPSNPEPVRWESWSGGETQRLQLAGDFGLANLIMAQAGLVNDIEFYDEPSDHLSESGLNDLAETLHQRALNDGKRIFLVDHRMPEFGEFSGVYTVIKDKDGSRIDGL